MEGGDLLWIVCFGLSVADKHFLPLQEICLLRALSYDQNIVQFYGACLDPEVPLLVLEYMQGGDLLQAIQRDAYPVALGQYGWYGKGAKIALDVAKGLVFLHKNKARLALLLARRTT